FGPSWCRASRHRGRRVSCLRGGRHRISQSRSLEGTQRRCVRHPVLKKSFVSSGLRGAVLRAVVAVVRRVFVVAASGSVSREVSKERSAAMFVECPELLRIFGPSWCRASRLRGRWRRVFVVA